MRRVYEVARKEVLVLRRRRRMVLMGGVLAALFVALAVVFGVVMRIAGDRILETLAFSGLEVAQANFLLAVYLGFPLVGGTSVFHLLVLVFTFDAVVREREDGSLPLLLARAVPRHELVVGKFLGAFFVVGVFFMGVATVAYFLVVMVTLELPSFADVARFYGGLLYLLLSLGAVAAMGVFASVLLRTSMVALIFALGVFYVGFELVSLLSQLLPVLLPGAGNGLFVEAWQYLNPSTTVGPVYGWMIDVEAMGPAGRAFAQEEFRGVTLNAWAAAATMVAMIVGFLGAASLLIHRRDFD